MLINPDLETEIGELGQADSGSCDLIHDSRFIPDPDTVSNTAGNNKKCYGLDLREERMATARTASKSRIRVLSPR
jgi:hypothetical protein